MKKMLLFFCIVAFSLSVSAQRGKTIDVSEYETAIIEDSIVVVIDSNGKMGVAKSTGSAAKIIVPLEYDDVIKIALSSQEYNKELFFIVKKDGKYGIEGESQKYIEPKYNDFDGVAGKCLTFTNNGKYGVVTLKGREILPAEYDEINYYANSMFSECDFICAAKNGKWKVIGYSNLNIVDVNFENVMADSFDFIFQTSGSNYKLSSAFYSGFARVKDTNTSLFGFVNPDGKLVVPALYDGVSDLGKGFFAVEKNEKIGFYSHDGKELSECKYEPLYFFSPDSTAIIATIGDNSYTIDLQGNEKRQASVEDLKAKYTYVLDCHNGQAIVYIDSKPSVMNYDGTVVIPEKYANIGKTGSSYWLSSLAESEVYYKVCDNTGKFALFNDKGVQITQFKYADAKYIGGNMEANAVAVVNDEVVRIGVCDKSGKEVIPLEYDNCYTAHGDIFIMKRGTKYGIVDASNKTAIPFELDSVRTNVGISDSKMICVEKGGKWALVDEKGKRLSDFVFDYIDGSLTSSSAIICKDYSDGMAAAYLSGDIELKYGYLDEKGRLAVPCIYNYAKPFALGLAPVKNESGNYGFIDKTGKVVLPFVYDGAVEFDPINKTARVKYNDEWILINTKGEMVGKP